MKTLKYIIFFLLGGICSASDTVNQEKTNDSPIPKILLDTFLEPSYANGSGSKDVMRLTILRDHEDSPIMIKWLPYDEKRGSSIIEVKKLTKKYGELKNDSYKITYTLSYNEKFIVDRNTSRSLSRLVSAADPYELPKKDWKGQFLGGSTWIYEFATEKGGYNVIRSCPLDFTNIKTLKHERIEKEMTLNYLGMVLWGLSKNQEAKLY